MWWKLRKNDCHGHDFDVLYLGPAVVLLRSRDPGVHEHRCLCNQLIVILGSAARCPLPRVHVRHVSCGHLPPHVRRGPHLCTCLQGARHHQLIWSEDRRWIAHKIYLTCIHMSNATCILNSVFYRLRSGLIPHCPEGLHSLSGRTSYHNTSGEVSKPRDSGLNYSNQSEIWQAPRQQRDACQSSGRCNNYHIQSQGFETSQDWWQNVLSLSE